MPRIIQQRRGSTGDVANILGAAGELFVDTSLVTVVVMDGVTTGGTTLARNADLTNLSSVTATNIASLSSTTATNFTNLTSSTNSSIAYLSSVAATKATSSVFGIVRTDGTSVLVTSGIISVNSYFANTITSNSLIYDSKGDVRAAPQNSVSTGYTLQSSDAGKTVSTTNGNITVNASVFNTGDIVTIFNNQASTAINIVQGTNVILVLAGVASTGTRTLSAYGLCTLLCITGGSNPLFACSGAGLS